MPTADVLAGELSMASGDELLKQAKAIDEAGKRGEKLAEARSAFVAARPHFEQAAEQYAKILAPLVEKEQAALAEKARAEAKLAAEKSKRPPRKTGPGSSGDLVSEPDVKPQSVPSERARVEEQWADARFKAVLIDYQISQTYSDPEDSRRFDALRSASDGFDEIFQLHRDDQIGMVAHFWQGRMLEELNDLGTAQDVFDEVLARASAGLGDLPPAVVDLLCDAESHRLHVLEKRKKLDLAIADAQRWLALKGAERHPQANMGIQMQLARLQLAKSKQSSADQAAALRTSANSALMKVAAVPGKYQREALLLMREQPGQANAAMNIQQALSVASAAAGNGLWDEAISGYRRAIDLGLEPRDHDRLMTARFELARVQLAAGKAQDALDTAERLAGDTRVGETGPQAGMLALSAAFSLFNDAPAADRAAADRRVQQAADKVIARWPGRVQADDARLALAKLKLVQDDYAAAIPWLEAVKASSARYSTALYLQAQTYWRLYLDESRQPTPNQPVAARNKDKAVRALETLTEHERKGQTAGAAPTESQRDAIMLLAEMYLEADETAKVGPLLEPLLASVQGSQVAAIDPSTLRVLALAMRAYLAEKQNDKAENAAKMLLEFGPDDRQVNGALVDYARSLRKQSAGQGGAAAAFTALAGKLASRKEYSLGERIFLGSVYRDLGRRTDAAKFFRAALDQADQEPTRPSKQMAEVLTQVRLVMIDMLREQEDFRAASEEADRLIQDNPRLLEAMIKKAEALQGWSTLDPEKLDAAAGQWIRVRSALQSAHAPPAVYYNAVYNTADCLYRLGLQTKHSAKIVDAEKILKATLITNQSLDGPATVARFQTLLKKIEAALPAAKPAAK